MPKFPDAAAFGTRPSLKTRSFGGVQGGDVSVARAGQELGQSIVSFGAAIGGALQKQEDHENKIRVEDAYNQLRNKQLDLTKGEESGFVHHRGADAATKPLYQDYNDKFQTAVTEISDTLDNEGQRELFKRRSDVSTLQFKQDLLNHVTQQKDTYAKEVYGGALILEQNDAASRWQDPNSIKMSLERINGVISEEADRSGWSTEKEKTIKLSEASKLHAGVIKQALASDNTDYAKKWYKDNKKVFNADARAEIEKVIAMGERKELAQTVSDEFINKDISETDAIKKIRKKYKGKEETEIVALLKTRYNEQEQAREAGQRTAGDAAWQKYEDTGDYSAIPITLINEMDGKESLALKKYAEDKAAGRTTKTDLATYQELLIEATTKPNEFMKRNILAYADKLSEADRRAFIQAKVNILKGQQSPEMVVARTRDQIVKSGIESMGGNVKDPYSEKSEKAYKRLDDEILAFQTQTGKKPSTADMQNIVDRLSIDVLRKRRFIWDVEEAAGVIEVEGVPTHLIDEYARSVQNAGQPVTQENIKKLYMYMNTPRKTPTKQIPQTVEPEFFEAPVPMAE